MKNAKVRIKAAMLGLLVFMPMNLSFGAVTVALSESDYYKYSENNIYFYDPTSCRTGVSNSSKYNNLVIGADTSQAERMANVVKQYGELAMDLQREWGTPWEVVFAQMEMESNTGTNLNSIAGRVAANGYFNWLGITGGGGSYSEGIPPYQGSDREWAQFPTVENMIKAWAGSYIARNGYYNKAFSNLDPASYDLRGFLNDFIMVYAPPKENDTSRYITSVIGFIEGPIKTAREEMGWPSSEELAIRENIPIGGRHPIGSDTGGSNTSVSTSGCTILRSAPDYNGSDYQGRLSNLHSFSQVYGPFSSKRLCGDNSSTISGAGCGLMSLAAAYYMFSGMGLNDEGFVTELLAQAKADGYNQCDQSATDNFGSNLSAYLNMTKENASDLSWDTLVGYLKQGKKILVSSGTEYFTRSSGHIMMLDHYNTETDTIYMFDPAIMADRVAKLDVQIGVNGTSYITYHGVEGRDGLSMSRKAMEELVQVRAARVLTYDGCYNGGVDICRSSYTGLKSGGMSLEEAEAFMDAYIEEAKSKRRGSYGVGYSNGTTIGDGWVNDAGCKFGALNNCAALSQWFVNNYTTAGPNVRSWNGAVFASGLISTAGFQDNGSVPVAYAIFSTPGSSPEGHTGVVLGVDEENGKAYFGEAFCNSSGFTAIYPKVVTYDLSKVTNGNYTYAYPGSMLKLGGL